MILAVPGILLLIAGVLHSAKHGSLIFILSYYALGLFAILNAVIFWLSVKRILQTTSLKRELANHKELLRTTLGSMTEGLITTRANGEILYMNPAAERLTGWNIVEAKDKPLKIVYDVINEETGHAFENIVSRILKAGKPVEFENNTILRARSGEEYIISNCGSPFFDKGGNIAGAVLVFNDITEKKRIEKRLIQREKQYRDLIQNLPEAVYTCDEYGYIQLYNKAAVKLWGREPIAGNEQWCGSWKSFGQDGKRLIPEECPVAIAVREQRPVYGEQIIIQRPDGSFRHVLPCPTPFFDDNGRLAGAINMLLDVTEKRERELIIQQTEEKYRHLFHSSPASIFIWDIETLQILEVNATACELYGYSPEEFKSLTILDLRPAEEHNTARLLAANIRRDPSHSRDGIWKHWRRNGEEIYMSISSHNLEYNGRTARMALGKDVTDRFVLKQQLERERVLKQQEITNAVLSAQENERQHLGRELHDNINQLLASAKLYMTMAGKDRVQADQYIHEADNLVNSAITEIRALSHSLIPPSFGESGLVEALEAISERVEQVAGLRVQRNIAGFEEHAVPEKLRLAMFRIVQEQFNNILKHARASLIHLCVEKQNDELVLSIKDDGIGFDPVQKTGGVGLLNIRTRASLFNGEVNIHSSPGNGCELLVRFKLTA